MHQEVKAANPSVGVTIFLCDSFYTLLLIITEHLIYVSLTFHTGKTTTTKNQLFCSCWTNDSKPVYSGLIIVNHTFGSTTNIRHESSFSPEPLGDIISDQLVANSWKLTV